MDNVTIITLPNGMLRLIPNDGYTLYNDYTRQTYAEAIVKTTAGFRAVLSGIQPTPHKRTLEDAKTEKLAALKAYDASTAVNSFSIGGQSTWIAPDERANYQLTVVAAQEAGIESVPFKGVTLTTDQAIACLKAVDIYAMQCVIVTEAHAAAINALTSIEAVDAYDFKVGYPEKLSF